MKKGMCLIFVLFIFVLGIDFVNAASLGVSANKTTVVVGSTVTITVNASGAAGWEYCLNYDSSVLSLTSSNSDTGGACVRTGSTLTGYSKVTYKLKAIKSGSTTVSLRDAVMYGDDGNAISSSNGSVSIRTRTQAEIEASYSTNADLKNLSIEGYEISPSFNKDTLEYKLEVENNVETIKINATKADNKATISGSGDKQLTEGINKFEIIVTAEKGNKKTYIIEVNRKELNPINVKVDEKNYTIVRKADALEAPAYYTATEVEIAGEKVPAFINDVTEYILVGLKDEVGNVSLYRYDDEKQTYSLYKQLVMESLTIIPVETDKLIEDYALTKKMTINNVEVMTYVGETKSDYVLVYGMNISNGKSSWYKYDLIEGTFQRYEQINDKSDNEGNLYLFLAIGFAGMAALSIILLVILMVTNSKIRKKNNKLIEMLENSKSKNNKVEEKVEIKEEKNEKVLEETKKENEVELEDVKEEISKENLSRRELRKLEKEKNLKQQEELKKLQEEFFDE